MAPVTPPPDGESRGIRRLRRVAIAVGSATGLILAVVFGWYLHDWLGSDEVVVSVDRPVQVYAPETVAAGNVPNVVGLTEEEARRVLSDAGIELSAVSTEDVPYVGPTSLVVRQTPASGGRIGDRKILLDVSAPARMPDLNGSNEGEARAALSELGARIAVVGEYQPGAAEGTVLSTEPPVGEPIADRATLHVAEPLSSIFLTQLEPVESSCRTGEEAVVAGETEEEAIVCQPDPGANPRLVTYVLGGQVESLRAMLGLDDTGDPEVPVEFRVYADGNQLLAKRLEFGDTLPIDVPLLGKLQLRLEVSALGGASGAGSLLVRAVFGEPQLVGSRSAVDRISEGLVE